VCYDRDALPPFYAAPITDVETSPVTLTSADGTRLAAYLARPERASGPAVLVLPDNNGLSTFYEQLTVRLAEQGHPALAIDYYARTAGLDYHARGEEFGRLENLMPNHLAKLTSEGLHGDMAAGIAHLHDFRGGDSRKVISLGFCMGGRFAFISALAKFGLDGVIGLYGYPDTLMGAPGPTQLAAELTAPVLGLFGGADEGIPKEAVIAFGEALTAAGVAHDFVTYPGAPHGFFEQGRPEHAEACADAWRRIMAFLAARA
jgi:carboxymethylenebutenolidase